jgi:hypothetical protein
VEGAPNDLELKLIAPGGENVWWWRRKAAALPRAFERVVVKKRHVTFAWGPLGGGEMKEVAAIEIAVVAGAGGKASVVLDELAFEERPPASPPGPARASASSSEKGFDAARAIDGRRETAWRKARAGGETPWLRLDFGTSRELGGVVVTFEPGREARDFSVQLSDDAARWRSVREVTGNGRTTSWISFPEAEARYLRLLIRRGGKQGTGVGEVEPKPPSFSESPDTRILEMAKETRPGIYPRAFSGQQSYWTVAGVDGDSEEVLVGEDGALEPGRGSFSLEPYLRFGDRLYDWSRVRPVASLAGGFLPIPSVAWPVGNLELSITALVDGPRDASALRARYRLRNTGATAARARLFVAVRPFLVNPPPQFLNAPHGVSPVGSLSWDGTALTIDGKRAVVPTPAPSAFGATTFDAGELADALERGEVPRAVSVTDPTGLASGAFAWDLDVPPGGHRDVVLVVPLHGAKAEAGGGFEERLAEASRGWRETLSRVAFRVPKEAEPLVATLRSNLAFVLVNRDGPSIQPGSRAYERSWIRDGALTSSALLRLGHAAEVRDFLVWFAGFQFPSGRIPCCVDRRGADPVPEHDSHGEFLFLAAEYLRFTADRETLEALWPRIARTVAALDALRKERRTPAYEAPEARPFRGLLPESISHEGYSDKPVHSYWDDFFALKGLKDAVFLAAALGRSAEAAAWTEIRDEFEADLAASLRRTIQAHRIAYIPGSVERHDFDPTSTTIALSPCEAEKVLPAVELRKTFERYVAETRERADGRRKSDVYTPYELRTVGALVRLGMKAEAHEMLAFFMKDRRPAAWNGWAEVVGKDPRTPRFLGDMPHTWVGTDFIRSFLDLFAYPREEEGVLVLGAGLPEAWVSAPGGVSVEGLRTAWGALDLSVSASGNEVRARVSGGAPPGGFVLSWPLAGRPREATVDGKPAEIRGGEILVPRSPAEVVARR